MHFGFALVPSDIDLWNIDLLDTHVDLLDTDIPNKHFVCLQDVFKTPSRHVFKTSSRHVFKTFSRHLRNNFNVKPSGLRRRLERQKVVTLKTCLRRAQDVLTPINVCWESFSFARSFLVPYEYVFIESID